MTDTYTDVVGERGEYRAKITIDTSPHEPENEMGCPVLRIDGDRWHGADVTDTGYGFGSTKADGLASAEEALERCIRVQGSAVDGVAMFDRWLRIWHGGGAVGYHLGYSREYGYCAYVTEAMVRNGWGNTTGDVPKPELSEWQAYCEGDVYWISVERRLLKRTEYVTLDDHHPVDADEAEVWFEVDDSIVGGYYGEQYAREAALEALGEYPGPNHEVFYVSADGTSTWSVYREEYLSPDDDGPIEGTTRRMSTWLTEEMAQAAAARLQAGESA